MALSTKVVTTLNKDSTQLDGEVSLGTILSNLFPSHYILAAGTHTSVGGDATESITVTGATSSDIAFAILKTAGVTPRTITTTAATTDAITVVMSGDPSTDHVIAYVVLRAVT